MVKVVSFFVSLVGEHEKNINKQRKYNGNFGHILTVWVDEAFEVTELKLNLKNTSFRLVITNFNDDLM